MFSIYRSVRGRRELLLYFETTTFFLRFSVKTQTLSCKWSFCSTTARVLRVALYNRSSVLSLSPHHPVTTPSQSEGGTEGAWPIGEDDVGFGAWESHVIVWWGRRPLALLTDIQPKPKKTSSIKLVKWTLESGGGEVTGLTGTSCGGERYCSNYITSMFNADL